MKPVIDIVAYTNCVQYVYPCGCKLTLKYGRPWNAAPERAESCGGSVAERVGEREMRTVRKGRDICEAALNHLAADMKHRADEHPDDPIFRRGWYTGRT